jgi:hypothetical protein
MNEFEQKLKRQPLRQVPSEWRAEILAATARVRVASRIAVVPRRSFFSMAVRQLANLLWPNQLAWGGLAAVWIFIIALQVSLHSHSRPDKSPAIVQKESPPSPEMLAELRKQQRLFVELIGPREQPMADRSKVFIPRPRSECVELVAV